MLRERLKYVYTILFANKFSMTVRKGLGLQSVPLLNPEYTTFDAARRHRSFDSMSAILLWLCNLTKKEHPNFDLDEKDALEIGTGKFFTHAIGLYVCGCNKVISVDKFRQLDERYIAAAMNKSILARRFLSSISPISDVMQRMQSVNNTGYRLQELEKIGVTYKAPYELELDSDYRDKFDFIISYTVLEHVPSDDLPELLNGLARCLKPGGVSTHYVDLEDHKDPIRRPFAFLEAQDAWNEESCGARGNRLRFSRWKKLFGQLEGMDWQYPYRAVRTDISLPDNLDSEIDYVDENDLRTTGFVAVGCKRA